jgi:hypothetical protein
LIIEHNISIGISMDKSGNDLCCFLAFLNERLDRRFISLDAQARQARDFVLEYRSEQAIGVPCLPARPPARLPACKHSQFWAVNFRRIHSLSATDLTLNFF